MHNPTTKPEELSRSFLLKRGTLFGAALGMFLGLIYLCFVGVRPAAEVASIIFWRNCILIGAAAGLCLGAIASWWLQTSHEPSPPPNKQVEHSAKSHDSTP